MVKRVVVTAALSIGLATLLVASISGAGEVDDRKELREKAGVEAGDRAEVRQDVRKEVDVDDRTEAREKAGVEAGDRVDRRKEVRERVE
jgi:hypothetical protein